MKSLLTLIFLSTMSAYASPSPSGYERGNGGFQILCQPQSSLGKGVYSLDRIEGEKLYQLKPDPRLHFYEDENEIVLNVLQKLEQINPTRAQLFRRWFYELLSHREFVEGLYIQPVNDGNVVILPLGCELRQAAVFIANSDQTQIRFIFDKSLWDDSSPLDRAFLLIHELLFRESRLPENNHLNSMASRYLNSWLFSNIETMNQDQWLGKLTEANFKNADYNGVPIILTYKKRFGDFANTPILRFPNSRGIRKAILAPTFTIKISSNEVFSRSCPNPIPKLGFTDWVEFYPTGRIKQLVFSEPSTYAPDCILYNRNNSLEFDELGNLKKASFINVKLFFDFKE
ncbi:hypothetical protein [Bdellovibrio sp.]|uniref:hypothetical protein n=1 Tax=Bdellovibrio sp. TaxID=28201 RepID=UPI0039E6031A